MKILHIVRRYGPVGGLERYVWEVTHQLAALGHQVEVICERCHVEKPPSIAVHELGEIAPRPRWLSLLRFGKRVARWLELNPHDGFIMHSHERSSAHQVTTCHGPPFATVREKPVWQRISLRVAMQLYLERRELRTAQYIVPNSSFIKQQLAQYYPQFAHKLTDPVVPGVIAQTPRGWQPAAAHGGIIGYVGKEWKRKGLPLAVQIVAQLRLQRPNLELWVIGPQPEEVQHLVASWPGGYRLLGWREQSYYAGFDVLLHPAKAEPYGMVISEAMSACVPVVVSDVCGAASDVTAAAGAVLPLAASVATWCDTVEKQLRRSDAPPQFVRGWDVVAREHEIIYQKLLREIT